MNVGRYCFTCKLETDTELPYYKGSTFRGVFGHALKKVVCALKHQTCETCLLNQTCLYTQVFESFPAGDNGDPRMAGRPRPFVIEPPLTTATRLPGGTVFDFTLLLIGETNRYLPYFIYAFEQVGKIGIGKKRNGRRGRFVLETVSLPGNKTIYASSGATLQPVGELPVLGVSITKERQKPVRGLKVTLKTPLRLKFNNRLQADLPFHLLVRAMLRRISSLMNAYGGGEPDLDYRGLVRQAEEIDMIENSLSWYDWQRYSSRQDARMLMGGMVGSVTYRGDLTQYVPLVDFCREVHIGKQTAFGLGQMHTELLS